GENTATLNVILGDDAVASTARYYRAVVTSGGCSINSSGAQLTIRKYCAPTYATGPGTANYIANVSVGSLNNSSVASASPYYTFYNNVAIPDLPRFRDAEVAITFGPDFANYAAVWIGFNQNGTF